MSTYYLHFTLDTNDDDARAAFIQRYGVEPEKVERVIKRPIRNGQWGWIEVGPIPGGHDAENNPMP